MNLKVRPLKINFLILRFINTKKSKTNFSLCNKIDFSLIFREIVRKYTFFFSGLAFVENINIRCIFAWKSRLLLDIEVIFVCNFTTFLWGGSSRFFFKDSINRCPTFEPKHSASYFEIKSRFACECYGQIFVIPFIRLRVLLNCVILGFTEFMLYFFSLPCDRWNGPFFEFGGQHYSLQIDRINREYCYNVDVKQTIIHSIWFYSMKLLLA